MLLSFKLGERGCSFIFVSNEGFDISFLTISAKTLKNNVNSTQINIKPTLMLSFRYHKSAFLSALLFSSLPTTTASSTSPEFGMALEYF